MRHHFRINASFLKGPYFLASIAVGIGYSFVDAMMMAFVFEKGSFWSNLAAPSPDDLWMRSSVAVLLVILGAITQDRMLLLRESAELLKKSEQRLSDAMESAVMGVIIMEEDGLVTHFNPFAEQMFGYETEEVVGRNVSILMPRPDSGKHDQSIQSYLETGNKKIIGIGREVTALRKNGEEFPARLSVGEIVRSGRKSFVGTITDITEHKNLEEQLRQAQKMEAVGQLTGGIAHDFNNLLAIIEGNLSLLSDDLDQGLDLNAEELRESIMPALEASRRGAELTDRLLAFSRKQALKPVALDINEVTKGMEGLLKRTLGEDIDLSWHLDCAGWLAEADESELGQALLNLVVNARDAMSEGGKLTIETSEAVLDDTYGTSHADVTPGEYVVLAVSDTGEGMDAATLERVFEPFFTTKEVGEGTGLGLSMVYGFARQSGGHVAIYSKPGEGTTVKLYLPRSLAPEKIARATVPAPRLGGNETILLVEDDEEVRRMAKRMLTRMGYRVLEAEEGRTALDILAREGSTDLLLTDVVLPGGMSGPEMARSAREKAPGLKILYMSGHNETAILHRRYLDENANLIGKPFSYDDLGLNVRNVLDAGS